MSDPRFDPAKKRAMARGAAICGAVIAGMFAMAFAAVPLYDLFCRVTGYGGTTQLAQAAPEAVLDRSIRVRFDTNVAPGLPLTLHARERARAVRIGETALVVFEARNPTNAPVTAVASYNVTPFKTGPYFMKMQCFCFQEQTIQPGETVAFPVVFFLDPSMDEDFDVSEVTEVTLSYTFFPSLDDAMESLQTATRSAPPRAIAQGAG